MNNIDICPYVRFAMHHTWKKEFYLDRVTWDNEIIFIESGSMKIKIDGKTYILKKNDCVIIRPGVPHIIEYHKTDCEQPHVHFDFYQYDDREQVGISSQTYESMSEEERKRIRPDFFKEKGIDIPYVIHLKEPWNVKRILFQIIDEFTYKKTCYEYNLQGLMIELIGTILREYYMSSDNSNHSMGNLSFIVSFMIEGVDDNITLDDITEKFKISKWLLIKRFNENIGKTPIKYYNDLRYRRAKELLQFSFMSVKEISEKMNFNDSHSFSRWFKTMDGSYPSDYRTKSKL